jgi:hypothetical protein
MGPMLGAMVGAPARYSHRRPGHAQARWRGPGQEIRKRNPQAVIVAATAANPMATAQELDDFSGVIYKPASLEDLQGVLSR